MTEEKAIANVDKSMPSFLQKLDDGKVSNEGYEHLKKTDIQIPRLSIAQGLSPQMIEGKAEYIEGLKMGEMFNSMSGDIYEMGPIPFYIVKMVPPFAMEFIPRKEGGGVKDRNVPLDDPRMEWTEDEEGNIVKPIATLFYEYVIVLEESLEVIGLSMKSTSLKAAKKLNGLVAMRKKPVYWGRYLLGTVREENNEGTYGVFTVANAGTKENPAAGWAQSEEQLSTLKTLYEQWEEKEAVIHEESPEEEEKQEKFDGQF